MQVERAVLARGQRAARGAVVAATMAERMSFFIGLVL